MTLYQHILVWSALTLVVSYVVLIVWAFIKKQHTMFDKDERL